jgi:polysaccharide export outer membrane protein
MRAVVTIAALALLPLLCRAEDFRLIEKKQLNSPLELIREFEAAEEEVYHLGPGDEITVEVWGRPELTGKHVVGPDGRITLPLAGALKVSGLSRDEAPSEMAKAWTPYYSNLSVTMRIDKYTSNRVYVLGRVSSPGVLQFERQPTLLDVITRAGGLPIGGVGADKAALARCAIFRGRDQVLWVDLRKMLGEGNLAYNIRLHRDDLVYIPDTDDQLVYVLGEATKPGAFPLTPTMSFMDALALAGGPNENASKKSMWLVRPRTNTQREVSLAEVLALKTNPALALEDGDIIYLPKSGMAKFGFVTQKIAPLTGFAIIGSLVK